MPKWSSQLWIELVYKKSILISSEPSYFLVIDYVKNKQTNKQPVFFKTEYSLRYLKSHSHFHQGMGTPAAEHWQQRYIADCSDTCANKMEM